MDDGIFNPDLYLERVERSIVESIPAPVAVIVSFPSNPTAQVVSLDFYQELVNIAIKHNVYILSDLAYAEIYYDNLPPPQFFKYQKLKKLRLNLHLCLKPMLWQVGELALQ